MKKLVIVLFALLCFNLLTCTSTRAGGEGNVDPYLEKMKLYNGDEFSGNSGGNRPLPGTPYGYEIWSAGGSDNRVIWYGPEYGGGGAFRAEWDYPNDFLARVGYFWNTGNLILIIKMYFAILNLQGRVTALPEIILI